jgi:ATP-binding cassette subfamily B (MDR/TAP) protein 1
MRFIPPNYLLIFLTHMCGLQVFLALTMAATAVTQSSSFPTDSQKAKIATASIFAIVDRKSKIDPCDESGISLDDVKGDIELHHVSFKYPSRPDVQIFRDLNLAIRAGKVN